MPQFAPKIFTQPSSSSSGITLSLVESKAGQYLRLGLSEAAQTTHFGGALQPDRDAVKIVLNSDAGKTHILVLELEEADSPECLPLSAGMKGSVYLKLAPWMAVASGKRPAEAMPVLGGGKSPSSVIVKLPEWARPEPIKIGQGKPLMD
ncbi:MAG: hypothetical protein CML69_10795 [Rhodobacteraceae bacterium]|nr:hypothetical protein [Paracoccaceae bacterium]MBA85210.1 hypothetical protein [Paracoccaceae bacterium]